MIVMLAESPEIKNRQGYARAELSRRGGSVGNKYTGYPFYVNKMI